MIKCVVLLSKFINSDTSRDHSLRVSDESFGGRKTTIPAGRSILANTVFDVTKSERKRSDSYKIKQIKSECDHNFQH